MTKRYIFTEAEKEQVKQAVKDLEKESCGEIVPYFARKSDDYNEAGWYAASVAGIFMSVLIAISSYYWLLPFRLTPLDVVLLILGTMLIGYLLPLIFPTSIRWIIPKEKQAERVFTRAEQVFLEEQVFDTKERVGILIFISRREHMVQVIGDKGINAKVSAEDWEHVVAEVVNGIKANQIGDGLVQAIHVCKDLLLRNGFVRKDTDTNELSDDLRIED